MIHTYTLMSQETTIVLLITGHYTLPINLFRELTKNWRKNSRVGTSPPCKENNDTYLSPCLHFSHSDTILFWYVSFTLLANVCIHNQGLYLYKHTPIHTRSQYKTIYFIVSHCMQICKLVIQLLDIDKMNKDNVGTITDDVICISEMPSVTFTTISMVCQTVTHLFYISNNVPT